MRCVVSVESSACNRCHRLGHRCEFRQDSRLTQLLSQSHGDRHFESNSRIARGNSQRHTRQTRALHKVPERGREFESPILGHLEPLTTQPEDLLSIYSTSPVTAVVDTTTDDPSSLPCHRSLAPNLAENYGPDSPTHGDAPLSLFEIKQFIHIFNERILTFIPVFTKEDFDPSSLYEEHRYLAYCICYVTSFFLPAGISVADALRGEIMDFVLDKFTSAAGSQEYSLRDLQAMMILYAYSKPSSAQVSPRQSISVSLLKSLVEGHAIDIGLHRSIEGVRAALKLNRAGMSSTSDFKIYTYWLWLYTLAHHNAILNRTPPSIRTDASIRNASRMLAKIDKSPRIQRLLGEVELCLIWEEAGASDRRLTEWWCVPDNAEASNYSPSAAVGAAETKLQAWRDRWSLFFARGGFGLGLDFHFRYARFCMSSYALRVIQRLPDHFTSIEIASVEQCMQYALEILDWTLQLSPVAKDALRYMSDFGFVMITFAALFVVQACQRIHPGSFEIESALGRVTALSELMMDLAVGSSHFTTRLGRSLQLRVSQIPRRASNDAQKASEQNSSLGPRGYDTMQIVDEGDSSSHNQEEESVQADDFVDEASLWDPTAWLNEFLTDAGDWTFS